MLNMSLVLSKLVMVTASTTNTLMYRQDSIVHASRIIRRKSTHLPALFVTSCCRHAVEIGLNAQRKQMHVDLDFGCQPMQSVFYATTLLFV